jgi:ribosomal protein S18 acetylase RimI-like enzyme/chorismate mutase
MADPDLRLRPATDADLGDIAELYLATRADAVPAMPPIARTPEEVRRYVGHWDLSDPSSRDVWIAEDDLGIAGFSVFKAAWLDALYVGPDRQGSGVGSALLDAAKGLRPTGFGLWVFVSNTPARAFYRRHELVELEVTDGSDNEERSPDLHMVWPGADPVGFLRGEMDVADRDLAGVLARRFALSSAIQHQKEDAGLGAGHAGRDRDREREIVDRMAAHTPGIPAGAVAAIMDTVIGESLTAWERQR